MIKTKEQEEILKLIGMTLKKRVECYIVGGTAMMFLGLKEATKDIDIVFEKKEHYEEFRKVLLHLGAKETETKIINRQKISSILTLGNAKFDLFFDYLIHFKLSKSIIERVKEVHEFSNLVVRVVSPEDIILFKSIADREGDRIDAYNLIKMVNIEWDVILKEAEEQTKNSEYFFSAFLYNFLIGITTDFKIEIPKGFMNRLKKIAENAMIEAEKKLKRKV